MSSRSPDIERPLLIEMDRLDLEAFNAAFLRIGSLREVIESGSRLIPEFDALARDVFGVFHKYNVVRLAGDEAAAGRLFRTRVLDWVLVTPGLEASKEVTRLDTDRSGLATRTVLEQVLELVRTPSWFDQRELLDQWQLRGLADREQDLGEQLRVIDELQQSDPPPDEATTEDLEALASDLSEERAAVRGEINRLSRAQAEELDRLPVRAENLVKDAVNQVPSRLAQAEEAADSYGSGLGLGAQGHAAADKMTLGERLLSNDKLRRLAELVGLFKQVARSSRKHVLERRPRAIHSIDQGSDLARLLTSELGALRQPLRRRDFLRRFVDGLLVQYAIQAPEPTGRGPLVVCIDASGSMRGARELWAKAIALTFLEIARRERRAFRAIVFSGQPDDARRFPLLESALDRRLRPPRVDPELVVEFADYFPGGGTDFSAPLNLALESLRESRFRRGDIVFITDGGATLSRPFLAEIERTKRALETRIFAVLVDVHGGHHETLEQFADEILRVSELTAEALRPVFRQV